MNIETTPNEVITEVIEQSEDKKPIDLNDIRKALCNVPNEQRTEASRLWYKINNVPGSPKSAGDTEYIVDKKGCWRKIPETITELKNQQN